MAKKKNKQQPVREYHPLEPTTQRITETLRENYLSINFLVVVVCGNDFIFKLFLIPINTVLCSDINLDATKFVI